MIIVQQIRNAKQIITYAGKRFLIDPIFADKGTYPPFPSLVRGNDLNPLHDLPIPIDRLTDVDAVILTHLHLDHFDKKAKQQLPKHIPVFVQNEEDKRVLEEAGFLHVQILSTDTEFEGVRLTKTGGRHGYAEEIAAALGEVCGVVLQNPHEETLYITGDTVWCQEVADVIASFRPSLIIVNAGANSALDQQLIMGQAEVLKIHEAAPDAQIIATHMEGVNHWVLSREELRSFAEQHGFSALLFIPEDGKTLEFR